MIDKKIVTLVVASLVVLAVVAPPMRISAAESTQVYEVCYLQNIPSDSLQQCRYALISVTQNPPNTPPETLGVCANYCVLQPGHTPLWENSEAVSSQYFTFCDSGPLLIAGPNWMLSALQAIDNNCALFDPSMVSWD